ncbi:MAG: LLM class flavin-dependent oxidoreductase [Pseudomonadota bacterium]
MSGLSTARISVLDLAPIRVGGDVGEALANSLALARCAEDAGYTRFWVAEHHNLDGIASSAPAVLIAHLAAHTARIRVGAGGVMLPNHAPLVVAEQFGTLAALHPGRIDLGLGRAPGTDPWTAVALRRGRADAAEHFPAEVAEIRRLLGPAQPGQRLVAVPGAGSDLQLWLLGSSLFSARLAAELGLPYAFASHFAPQQLDAALALYRREFRPAADLAAPQVAIGVPLVAAPTDDEAEFLASSLRRRWLALLRGGSLRLPPPTADALDASPGERAAVAELLGVAAIGGRERVCGHLAALLARTGAEELLFTCDIHDQELRRRALRLLAEWRAAG